jgi:sulfatase modifying factor 1
MKLQKSFVSALVLGAIATGTAQSALVIPTVLVGDAGNAADSTGYGAVSYEYRIGKYEVTLNEYTAFLNAVAATDSFNLYNTNMASDLNIAGISRSGSSGSYSYSVIGSGNRPVTYVNWFDAARFANWMANGQPTGMQGNATTENGAYSLFGAASGVGFTKNAVNPNTLTTTTWWIPSEDEWYKAAFHDSGMHGPVDDYWLYPSRSDSAPGNSIGAEANNVNYNKAGLLYSVTQNFSYSSTQSYLTAVGAYSGSGGYYGTYDQGGNVAEWNTSVLYGSTRGVRGGSWWDNDDDLYLRGYAVPSLENSGLGFRVASVADSSAVPEPGQIAASGVLLIGGGLYWLVRRRKVKVAA